MISADEAMGCAFQGGSCRPLGGEPPGLGDFGEFATEAVQRLFGDLAHHAVLDSDEGQGVM